MSNEGFTLKEILTVYQKALDLYAEYAEMDGQSGDYVDYEYKMGLHKKVSEVVQYIEGTYELHRLVYGMALDHILKELSKQHKEALSILMQAYLEYKNKELHALQKEMTEINITLSIVGE